MTDENTETKLVVGTNYLTLPFKTDPLGTFQAMRDGTIKSIRRIRGDKDKMKQFRDTLRILVAFANEEFDRVAAEKANFVAVHADASARNLAIAKKRADKRATELEDTAARIRTSAGIKADEEIT